MGADSGAPAAAPDCELCERDGGTVLWRDEFLRILAVDDPDFPGFTRVVWNAHAREMSDLAPPDRARLLEAVVVVEEELRALLQPEKINLASLGNVVPHLHWHVIPRFADDSRFPQPVWATALRPRDEARDSPRRVRALALGGRLALRMAQRSPGGEGVQAGLQAP
jgi:diadenosine tetraphosphate (Ap4A) HIT family hydrolase